MSVLLVWNTLKTFAGCNSKVVRFIPKTTSPTFILPIVVVSLFGKKIIALGSGRDLPPELLLDEGDTLSHLPLLQIYPGEQRQSEGQVWQFSPLSHFPFPQIPGD